MKTPDTRAAKRKGNVKARRMWHLHYADADTLHHTEREAQKIADKCEHLEGYPPGKKPVFVLPADAASYERMVEQMAKSLWDNLEDSVGDVLTPRKWRGRACRQDEIRYRLIAARAVLAAIGIYNPKTK